MVSPGRGLLLGLFGTGVISVIDNLVRPLLTRFGLHMHPLWIFLAIFGGLASFGLSGVLLGPLFIAMATAGLRQYERQIGGALTVPPPPYFPSQHERTEDPSSE